MPWKFFYFVITLIFVPSLLQCKASQLLEQQSQTTQQDVNGTISETTSRVRLIYFTPQDRPFKQRIVDQIELQMEVVQTFFADQMEAHGFGRKTFAFETDVKGRAIVHRVKGQFPDKHYLYNTTNKVGTEIGERFNLSKNVYMIVVDISGKYINGAMGFGSSRRGGQSGILWIAKSGFQSKTIAHELGHAFGLLHDFRNERFLMSYGSFHLSSTRLEKRQLSKEAAEFLDASRFFNPSRTFSSQFAPKIKIISPLEYPPGAESIRIIFELSDPDGLHQARFHTNPNITDKNLAKFSRGSPAFKASKRLNGQEMTVEFVYKLSKIDVHDLWLQVVDSQGHFGAKSFSVHLQK